MAFILPAMAAIGGSGGAMAGLGLVAGGVAGLGTAASAIAASNAAEYNAKAKDLQAQQASDQAAVKASEVARNTRQQLAAGRAGAIENGFDLTGSVNDVLDQTERQGNLDYLTAVYDGSAQAFGLRAGAALDRSKARDARVAGVIGIASQALNTVSSVYGAKGNSVAVGGT